MHNDGFHKGIGMLNFYFASVQKHAVQSIQTKTCLIKLLREPLTFLNDLKNMTEMAFKFSELAI